MTKRLHMYRPPTYFLGFFVPKMVFPIDYVSPVYCIPSLTMLDITLRDIAKVVRSEGTALLAPIVASQQVAS